ncbi:Uncharacterized protein KF715C_pA3900 (plasmid) [Pseudomonas putida]|uniref:Uncharacterized protein n=1 Tax=Pseudomonas putida TaxID=303 RepID=A0A1L7NN36_PSEPU|nr:Uncharacterized protein KF715C_pA3900 [Pseudomonas putida]
MPRISLSNKLRDWSRLWVLDGDDISCRECKMATRASEPDRIFVHGNGCSLQTSNHQFPWRDLAEAMAKLPGKTKAARAQNPCYYVK